MSAAEVVVLGIGLSMDSAAVSMSNAMVHRKHVGRLFEMALWFSLFQGVMPLAGYCIGGAVSRILSRLGPALLLLILGVIALRMIRSGLCKAEECPPPVALTRRLLLVQAAATSIDALAVGVGLRAGQTSILPASLQIAVTTLLCSLVAIGVGRRFGGLLGRKAEVLGGVILLLLGIHAVL